MNKKIRVGHFAGYIPHYRLGLYKNLHCAKNNVIFTFCAPVDSPGSFLSARHKQVKFNRCFIRTLRIHLPFTSNVITIQPYAIWCMLSGKYDVFIMSNDVLRVCVWINVFLAMIFNRSVCIWGHGMSRRRRNVSEFLRRILMWRASAIIFYTEKVQQEWIARGLPKEKTFVAYNTVDTEAIARLKAKITTEDLKLFQAEHNLLNKKVVLFSGRLLSRKSPDILIRAMRQVVEKVPEAHLVLIGDGPIRSDLEKLVLDLRLSKHVNMPGAVYDDEVAAAFFMSSSFVVMPSWAGLIVQHAFSYGLPVITGDNMERHPPEVELIGAGETGLFCRDGDVGEFANAICRLLQDVRVLHAMAQNCEKVIEEKYNVANMAKGVLDAVEFCSDPTRRK